MATNGDRSRSRNAKTPVAGYARLRDAYANANGYAVRSAADIIAAYTNSHTNDRRLHIERLGRTTVVTTARIARFDLHSIHRWLREFRRIDRLAFADRRVPGTGSFGWVICSLIIFITST